MLCCPGVCLCVLSPCWDARCDISMETLFSSSLFPLCCLFAHFGVRVQYCVVFSFYFYSPCVLPVFLDFPFLIASSVFSNVYCSWIFVSSSAFYEMFEDTKEVIRSCKSTKDRQYNGKKSSSCSTHDTRRVTLITNPVISHEWGKEWIVITTSVTYPWSRGHLSIRYSVTVKLDHGDRKTIDIMTLTWSLGILASVAYYVLHRENWIHLFCHKVRSQHALIVNFEVVSQAMKQT